MNEPTPRQRQLIDEGNARLAAMGRDDVHWFLHNGKIMIGDNGKAQVGRKPLLDRRGQPMSHAETAELNRILESLNATARYRSDGSRYTVAEQ